MLREENETIRKHILVGSRIETPKFERATRTNIIVRRDGVSSLYSNTFFRVFSVFPKTVGFYQSVFLEMSEILFKSHCILHILTYFTHSDAFYISSI